MIMDIVSRGSLTLDHRTLEAITISLYYSPVLLHWRRTRLVGVKRHLAQAKPPWMDQVEHARRKHNHNTIQHNKIRLASDQVPSPALAKLDRSVYASDINHDGRKGRCCKQVIVLSRQVTFPSTHDEECK